MNWQKLDWQKLDRQKLTGWLLIIASGGWLVYFLKTRLFAFGPPLERQEWIYAISSLVLIVLGTINVRMAAMREQKRNLKPNVKR
jgi:hypothetical protein